MSTFRAFQTGLQAGQQQAKVRREDDARVKAAEAFGKGNYEGASASLMGVGLMDEADAYDRAAKRKIEAESAKTYADAFKTGLGAGPTPNKRGGYEAIGQAAAGQGDFNMMAQVDQAIAGMDAQQADQFGKSMEFLGQTALGLKQVAPEMRGQAAMEILQNSPYANPQIMQQIQQAAADGKITDEELDNFAMQTMSVADRVKARATADAQAATNDFRGRQLSETERHNRAMEGRQPGNGISVGVDANGNPTVQIGGPLRDNTQITGPTKTEAQYYKDIGAYEQGKQQRETLLNNLTEAEKLVGGWTTGIGGALTSAIPGSQAVDLQKRLETVQALIGFDALNRMRQNSPTGGALGNVTERELNFLQSVQGSLSTIQSEAQLRQVMKEIRASVERLAQAQDQAFQMQYQAVKPGETRAQPKVTPDGVQMIPGLSAEESAEYQRLKQKFGGQ